MKTKNLIFIFGNICSIDKIEKVFNAKIDNRVYISDSLFTKELLLKNRIESNYLYHLSNSLWNDILSTSLSWLTSWPNTTTTNGKKIDEYFNYKQIPLWWFIYDALFEVSGGIFDAILYFSIYKKFFDNYKPSKIFIIGDTNSIACQNLMKIVEQTDIEFKITSKNTESPFKKKEIWKNQYKKLLKKILNWFDLLVIKKILLNTRLLFRLLRKKNNKCAFLCHHGERSLIQLDHNNILYITDNIYKDLEKTIRLVNNTVLSLSLFEPVVTDNRLINKFKNWIYILKGTYIPWYSNATYFSLINFFFKKRKHRNQVKTLLNDPKILTCFKVGDYNFLCACIDKISDLLPSLLSSTCIHLNIADTIISTNNIQNLYTVEAHSTLGRALALALNARKGKLIGLQGGIITPYIVTNSGFYLSHLMKSKNIQLVPNEFHIWGCYYQNLLITKYQYPPNDLHVKGNINCLNITNEPKIECTENSNTILYIASSNIDVFPLIMPFDEELFTIFSIAKSLPNNYILSIRLHPSHPYDLFCKELSSLKNIDLHSSSSYPLIKELSNAKLVLTKASSVLFDALAYNKIVILLNYANTPDFTGIINEDYWDLIAKNHDELKRLISIYINPNEALLIKLNIKRQKLLNCFVDTPPLKSS